MNVFQRAGLNVKAFQMRFGRSNYQQWGAYGSRWFQSYAERARSRRIGQGLGSSVVVAPLAWLQRNMPDAPLRVRRIAEDSAEEVRPSETGPGALLKRWNSPNEYYSGRTMMKALIADYKTTGNAFVLKIRNPSGRWVQSWWAPSWSMTPRWPEDGSEYLSFWSYNIDGQPQRIDPDDVIHFRDGIDPQNSRLGFCGFASLVREVFTDEEASSFTTALLANLGIPGVVISPSAAAFANGRGAPILDTAAVKKAFNETFGGDNRGDAMVMSGPTDVSVLAFNPQQMTLRDLRKLPEERVSGVFGVPAIVSSFGAGLDRSTFANYGEAREAAYEEGAVPTHGDFADVLKQHGLSEFVDDVDLFLVDFDISEVRVLQEDQNKLWTRALDALKGGGITRARFKEMVGETADPDGLDEVYYIPIALAVTPAAEDQTQVPVESSKVVPEPGTDQNPAPPPGNPLALPPAVPAPTGGNGNGGGTRVPVGAR